MLTLQQQGDLGEAQALEWFVSQGALVFVPFGHSPDCDFVAETRGSLLRVQVKTSRRRYDAGYAVQICTRGGNQSWSGVSKLFDPARYDLLFVVVADGRRWCIPTSEITAQHAITVGNGDKWARFEVEQGRPLVDGVDRARALDSSLARWGTEAVKRGGL